MLSRSASATHIATDLQRLLHCKNSRVDSTGYHAYSCRYAAVLEGNITIGKAFGAIALQSISIAMASRDSCTCGLAIG